MTFVAVPLIVGGLVMKPFDDDFRELRNDHARSFDYHYDDYVQYLPMATMFGMKAFGVRSRSSWGRMLVSDAFSAALMATAVNSLKYSCKVMRPDGSTRNSFPSGHTATAFMAATMLHKEYGHLSPWVSVGGYTVATLTGVSRQLNNRHWVSDVMVGPASASLPRSWATSSPTSSTSGAGSTSRRRCLSTTATAAPRS